MKSNAVQPAATGGPESEALQYEQARSVMATLGLILSLGAACLAIVHYFERPSQPVAWKRPESFWIAELKSTADARQDSALAALERLHASTPSAIAALTVALSDSTEVIRRRAAGLLIELGRSSSSATSRAVRTSLMRALHSASPQARGEAAFVLGKVAPDSVELLALVLASKDRDESVRSAAVFALGESMHDASPAINTVLVRSARDSSAIVRAIAIEALASAPLARESLMPVLAAALHDRSSMVREEAIRALAALGTRAEAFRPALMDATADSAASVRDAAKSVLERLSLVP